MSRNTRNATTRQMTRDAHVTRTCGLPNGTGICSQGSAQVVVPDARLFVAARPAMPDMVCVRCGLRPERTQQGRRPAWEIAKACAFSTVIAQMSAVLDQPPNELLGKRVDEFIAEQLHLVGGGNPSARAVRNAPQWAPKAWCRGVSRNGIGGIWGWYPGVSGGIRGIRPPSGALLSPK